MWLPLRRNMLSCRRSDVQLCAKCNMIKKRKNMLFFCHFAEFSKTTMENYGIFTTLRLYDYATTMENRRKIGRSRVIAHFSSNFWSKIGWIGREYTNLGNFRKIAYVFAAYPLDLTNSHISRRSLGSPRRLKSFRGLR